MIAPGRPLPAGVPGRWARQGTSSRFRGVTMELAAQLVDVDDLAERQRRALVPLELRLAAGASRVSTPEALLKAAHTALQESFGE